MLDMRQELNALNAHVVEKIVFMIKKITIPIFILLCLLHYVFSNNAHIDNAYAITTINSFTNSKHELTLDEFPKLKHEEVLFLRAIHYFEKKYSIPDGLLYAITVTESGMYKKSYNVSVPWPWILNVQGRPMRFGTLSEAKYALLTSLKNANNVDVGGAQINMRAHMRFFQKPEYALHPVYNAAYAGYLLWRHYNGTHSWSSAVARYHSGSAGRGQAYKEKVLSIWREIRFSQHYRKLMMAIARSSGKSWSTMIVDNNKDAKMDNDGYVIRDRNKAIGARKHANEDSFVYNVVNGNQQSVRGGAGIEASATKQPTEHDSMKNNILLASANDNLNAKLRKLVAVN